MTRPKKFRNVSFSIPREIDEDLELLRKRFGISKSELIRFFILRGLEDLKSVTDELMRLREE